MGIALGHPQGFVAKNFSDELEGGSARELNEPTGECVPQSMKNDL
jgi:hypothetical protein